MSPFDSSSNTAPIGSNLWFASTIGLLGIIIGFGFGQWHTGISAASAPGIIAQAPDPLPSSAPAAHMTAIDPKTDRIWGDLRTAQVAIVEYSDFECPFCKRLYDDAERQVRSSYGDKVVWVYRDFPLSFHQNAHKEADAGRCVFALGGNDAFWKYHDYVFEKTTSNGTGFPLDQLPAAAKQAGVDVDKFQNCLDSGTYTKAVDDQEAEGGSAGVNGTPGNFVVNLKTQKTQMISGAQPFSAFKSAIDAALAQ